MNKTVCLSLICALFLIIAPKTYSQNIVCIKDVDTKETLVGVHVFFLNTGKILSYTTSNSQGYFKYDLKSNFDQIKLTYIGYKSITLDKDLLKETTEIFLKSSPFKLREAVVRVNPLTIEGDTVVYDVSSFKQESDLTLKQVLLRLPGVTVSNTGIISFEGTNISHFYIEGMDLLGGRYGVATENLRPDDISSIQFYKNHQPIKALKRIEITNKPAVNIKLKDKAKSKWLFTLDAAIGYKPLLYDGSLTAMRFNSNSQSLFTLKSNNTGRDIIQETAMRTLGVGAYRVDEIGRMSNLFNISSPSLPIPSEYYYLNNSNVLSLNQLWKTHADVSVRANVILDTDKRYNYQSTEKTITFADNSQLKISDEKDMTARLAHLSAEVNVTSNKEKKYVENQFKFEGTLEDALSNVGRSEDTYVQKYTLPKFEITNNLKVVNRKKSKSKGNDVANTFYSKTKFSLHNQELNVSSNTQLPFVDQENALQKYSLLDFSSDNYLKRSVLIGKMRFSLTPGVDIGYQELSSDLNNLPEAKNDISLFNIDPYLLVSTTYKIKKLELNLYVPLHFNLDHYNSKVHFNFITSSYLNLDYDINSKWSMSLNASIDNDIGDIKTLTTSPILFSYSYLRVYQDRDKYFNQTYGFNIHFSDLMSFVTSSLRLNYSRSNSALSASNTYIGEDLVLAYIKSPISSDDLSANFNFRKKFYEAKISMTLNGGYNYNISSEYLQNEHLRYTSSTFSYGGKFSWTRNKYIELRYSIDGSNQSMFQEVKIASMFSLDNKAGASFYPFKNFKIGVDYFNMIRNVEGYGDINLNFLDADVEYSIKKWRIFLKAINLFNVKEYRMEYISTSTVINERIEIRPMQFLLGFAVKF